MEIIYIDNQPVLTGEIKTLEYKPLEYVPDPETFELDLFKKKFLSNMDFSTPVVFNAECKINNDFIVKDIKEPYTMSFNRIIKPKRKHHKKRIQKKWLKRYGYKTAEDVYKIKDISPTLSDSEIMNFNAELEFIERRIR